MRRQTRGCILPRTCYARRTLSGSGTYTVAAIFYTRMVDPLLRDLRAIGLSVCPPQEGTSVLDVGCGTGTLLRLYKEGGCQVSGVDLSEAMLQVARRTLGPDAQLHLGDATRLPYRSGAFDLVTMMMVIHEHDPETRWAMLTEAKRVVTPGGRLLVIDFHPGSLRSPRSWPQKALITSIEFLAGWEHFRNHLGFLAAGGLPAMLARCGLELDRSKIVGKGTLGIYLLRPL